MCDFKKVMVVSDLKLDLNYRYAQGHRSWRRVRGLPFQSCFGKNSKHIRLSLISSGG
jgi:hypothetical protein